MIIRKQNQQLEHKDRQLRAMKEQLEQQLQHTDYLKSSWEVERKEIRVIQDKVLGKGGWGVVMMATFRGTKVAAKFLHEDIISPHNIGLFIREMDMASRVRHPNLLLFMGASVDDNKPFIITELMPANLGSKVQLLSRGHVISIATDVACGLNYLHLMKPDPIIHRDVSSANVLLESIGPDQWRAKLSDFGSANFVSKVTTQGPGNSSYAAPESFNRKLQTPKMDVYSFGILLLEMATGQFPDHALQDAQLQTLPWQEMADLIRRCICEEAANRPDMKDVLHHLQHVLHK